MAVALGPLADRCSPIVSTRMNRRPNAPGTRRDARSVPRFVGSRWVLFLTLLFLTPTVWGRQSDSADGPVDHQETMEEILVLRRQLEALLATLPPELRKEVERQWRDQLEEGEVPPATPAVTEPVAGTETIQPENLSDGAIAVPGVMTGAEPEESTPIDEITESSLTATTPDLTTSHELPPPCVHLAAFDSNHDRVVSASDRYWRYLRLWSDNGDGIVDEELEIDSLYELGIREIRVELDYYGLPNNVSGDITVGEQVQLILIDPKRNSAAPATLVVQAGRMARGGEIWIADQSGTVLDGYQSIGPTIVAETSGGQRLPLVCR